MELSGNTFFFSWEVSLMAWLQANISDAWISFMSFFSLFGEELPLILIVGFMYWSYDKKLGRKVGLLVGFMGGTLLDDYCVHYEDTRKPLFMVTRLLGGLAVYLVLNTVLKMPFSNEFLTDGNTAALMVRCTRYAIIAFVDFGVYPMLFKFEKRKCFNKI